MLLLRDVLGMPAEETATALGLSVSAANSALHRARSALGARVTGSHERAKVDATSEVNEELLGKYVRAWEAGDLDALVALLHDEVIFSMPPSATWFSGKLHARAFLAARPLPRLAEASVRITACGANGQPALAFYVDGNLHAVQVVRSQAGRVIEVHHFGDEASFAAFRLAPTLESLTGDKQPKARATMDPDARHFEVSVELKAALERVFQALASPEIVHWWVRPGVFNATEWAGDVRAGGRWSVTGLGCGAHCVLDG